MKYIFMLLLSFTLQAQSLLLLFDDEDSTTTIPAYAWRIDPTLQMFPNGMTVPDKPITGTTYYVSPTGGGDTLVFNDIAGITLNNGDALLLKTGGTYAGSITLSEDTNITIASYGSGEKPIINSTANNTSLTIRNCSNIEIRNLVVKNAVISGVSIEGTSSGVVIKDVESYKSGNQAYQLLGTAEAKYYNIVGDSCVDDGFSMHDTTTAIIYGGRFNNNDQGINIIANAKLTVYGATIHNNTTFGLLLSQSANGNCVGKFYGVDINTRILIIESSSVEIHSSHIHNIAGSHAIDTETSKDLIFTNNLVDTIATGKYAVAARSYGDMTLRNNTLVDNDKNGNGIYLSKSSSVANNIYYNLALGLYGDAAASDTNGCYYNNTAGYNVKITGVDSIKRDPKFVNLGIDYSLQSSSPCINSGVTRDYADINNALRVGITDRGAYEYGGVSRGWEYFKYYQNPDSLYNYADNTKSGIPLEISIRQPGTNTSGIEKGFVFDGVNDYIAVECTTSTTNSTLSAWVKFTTTGAERYIFGTTTGYVRKSSSEIIQASSGTIYLDGVLYSGSAISAGWHLVTVTGIALSGTVLNVGASITPGSYLSGFIDRAGRINGTLSANQVLKLYNDQKARYGL